MRANDIRINDEPKSLVPNPTDDHHAMVVPVINKEIKTNTELRIPLFLIGVTSYFTTRKPTQSEYDTTPDEMCLDLTFETPEWDPRDGSLQQQEEAFVNSAGNLRDAPLQRNVRSHFLSAIHTLPEHEPRHDLFGTALENA